MGALFRRHGTENGTVPFFAASTGTVSAPAGQGAIPVHVGATLVVALPNRNAVRRDAGTVECRDVPVLQKLVPLNQWRLFLPLAVLRRRFGG